MRKLLAALMILSFGLSTTSGVYADDWDKVGMILTGITGLRIISGGKVDVIGGLTGINRNQKKDEVIYARKGRRHNRYRHYCSKIWVPETIVWKRKYIPKHKEYSQEYDARIVVEGHYIKYPVRTGGYWTSSCSHH